MMYSESCSQHLTQAFWPRDRIHTFTCAFGGLCLLDTSQEFLLLLLLTSSAILEHVRFKTSGDIINTQSYFEKL